MILRQRSIVFAGLFGFLLSSLWGGKLIPTDPNVEPAYQPYNGKEANSLSGPLRVSPDNPRYFVDGDGRLVYLTGSHTWANFQDIGYSNPPPVFDYNIYLDFLQANNHNFIRLWVWEQSWGAPWSNEIWVTPLPYQRSGEALDGKSKFDLTKFDQSYFDRLRDRVIQAGERGMYVSIMLFDGWSVGVKNPGEPGNPWRGHPFNEKNNINGVNGDPNGDGYGYEIQNLSIDEITAIQEAYVRKVIDTLTDLDNTLFEICNECEQDSTAWQYHMIDFIHEYERTKSKQHPVGLTVEYPNGNNAELFDSPADWISPKDYFDPPVSDGSKVIIADTDHIWGIGGDRGWVWRSFMRGINPIFMDCYNPNYCEGMDPNNLEWVSLRKNMGYTLDYTRRIDLMDMIPRNDLCSSGYCLVNPAAEGAEYLVYLPDGDAEDVDLSGVLVDLSVEWFDPKTGLVENGDNVFGGGVQEFNAPFSGDAVLFIYDARLLVPTPMATYTMPPPTSTTVGDVSLPTPTSPGQSLPCASGLLILGGAFGVLFRSGHQRRTGDFP